MSNEKLDRLMDIPDPFAGASSAAPPIPRLPKEKSPTREEREHGVSMAITFALLWQIFWLVWIEHRPDFFRLDPSMITLGVGVPLYLSFGGLYVALRPGPRGLGSKVMRFVIVALASPVLFARQMWLLSSRITDDSAPFLDRTIRCLAVTLALSAPPMAMFAWVLRRAFVAASVWRGAAIGVACGALAAATMTLACVHFEALHLIVAHGSMMIIGGIAGAVVGRSYARA
jgi:hypothetical protein